MSEKEKSKRSTRMGFLRSCLIFSLYPLIVIKVLVSLLVFWAIGGYVKPSLDAQYIPTAEYLLEHPIDRPEMDSFDFVGTYIEFDSYHTTDNQLCFVSIIGIGSELIESTWLEVYINEQVATRFLRYTSIFDSMPAQAPICLYGHLDSGLHIIEFRAKESLFAEPYYIQRWTIEIP